MKKAMGLLLTLIMVVFIAACGNSDGNSTSTPPSNSSSSNDGEVKEIEKLNLKLGTIRPYDDPTTIAAQKFAELVGEKSGGKHSGLFPFQQLNRRYT